MAYPQAAFPQSYGQGRFGSNRSYIDYMQRLRNRMAAEQILADEEIGYQAPVFDPRMYQEHPNIPYLSGLSPMARFRDNFLRRQGDYARSSFRGVDPRQFAQEQQMVADYASGVTQQPDGGVTTAAGGRITPIHSAGGPTRVLTSPYGTGSSGPATGAPGTFSFTDASGARVTSPFSALKDPTFMKYMTEEEVSRRRRGETAKRGPDRSFEDIMKQLESV